MSKIITKCDDSVESMYRMKNNNTTVLIHATDIESSAYDQIKTIQRHPAIHGLVAIMPDVHAGAGCVIGYTGRFKNAVIPNIIGVDIGCGVLSYKLPSDIELNLKDTYNFIHNNIPSGFNSHETPIGLPNKLFKNVVGDCSTRVQSLKLRANPELQTGTLGGGNHFIEIEKSDSTGDTYVTIHSGSRKFGLEIAKYHQNKAVELMKKTAISVPKGLEYLPLEMGGDEYVKDMYLAQRYADVNRYMMLTPILKFINVNFNQNNVIHSVHNYLSPIDNIARKGAISAMKDEKVVIPLNMGKDGGIIIGNGVGNKNYNFSAPHGAGRVAGRGELKRRLKSGEISMEMFQESMDGVYSEAVVDNTIDEAPLAYKPFDNIRQHLMETVEISDHAKPILSFKDT